MTEIDNICVPLDATLRSAMVVIDRAAKGIALVVDDNRRLLFTLTDGDVRRAILRGVGPEQTLAEWAQTIPEQGNRRPTTALVGSAVSDLLARMAEQGISQIPLVDAANRVVALVLRSELLAEPDEGLLLRAVVMAGGQGVRLRPLTVDTPKPLLSVAGRPVMEHIVDHLRTAGIRRVSIATHYKAERIVDHFGDGSQFGVDIDYLSERQPLGTAGGLSLSPAWKTPLLVLNGDVLTRLNYRSMFAFHREQGATATMAVRQFDLQVPYGVVESEGPLVTGVREKPILQFFVNAGIYLLEPEVHQYLSPNVHLDMTELMTRLIEKGKTVVSFPIAEYWIDIGQHADYERAQQDAREGPVGA